MFNGFVAPEINSEFREGLYFKQLKKNGKRQAVCYSVHCTLYIGKS